MYGEVRRFFFAGPSFFLEWLWVRGAKKKTKEHDLV
jgi:hypothetical protein